MSRTLTFKLRINQQERRLLAVVAAHLRRSQADAIRFLVKAAAQELNLGLEKVSQVTNQPQGEENG